MVTWWHSAVSLSRFCTVITLQYLQSSAGQAIKMSPTEAWRGIGNLLQKFNWIIADWALGDMRGAELSAGCGFQYHGTARRRVLCNVLWAPGLCRHHIRCLATDRSGLCRLSWSVSDHQCFTGTRKTGCSPSLSTISFKCLQYSAVQCVMYDVFFSLGSLVISFWMLLLPSQPCVPDVMSNGCVY